MLAERIRTCCARHAARGRIGPVSLVRPRFLSGESASADVHQVWEEIWDEAAVQFKTESWQSGDLQEFGMDRFLHSQVLRHKTLESAMAHNIGGKLQANTDGGSETVDYVSIMRSAFKADPEIGAAIAADLMRFKVVDPATDGLLGVYLFYKGVQAIACARVGHHYWTRRGPAGKLIARLIQSETSDVFGVDIHPGCRLGRGVTMDHATGVTLGETCVIGNDVCERRRSLPRSNPTRRRFG